MNVPTNHAPIPIAGADGSKPPRLSWAPAKVSRKVAGASSIKGVSLDANTHVHVVDSSDGGRQGASMDDRNSLLMPNPYNRREASMDDHNSLLGPNPYSRTRPYYYDYEMAAGTPGQDTTYDVLDDTHFNGDLDEDVLPAEESFNRRLRQEGVLRRKVTRMMMEHAHDRESLWEDLGQQVGSPTSIPTPGIGEFSPPPTPSDSHGHLQTLPTDAGPETLGKEGRLPSEPTDPRIKRSERASISSVNSLDSIRDKITDVAFIQEMLSKNRKGAQQGEEVALQFNDEEVEDMLAMTEFTWPGSPMLGKLLKEEVARAKGPVLVACERFFLSLTPRDFHLLLLQAAARLN